MIAIREVTSEFLDIEPEISSVSEEIVVFELMLALEEEIMHLPEITLGPRSFRCQCRSLRERVNIVPGEVPEDETKFAVCVPQSIFDHVVRPPTNRAFEFSVLYDRDGSVVGSADAIAITYGVGQFGNTRSNVHAPVNQHEGMDIPLFIGGQQPC